MAEYDGADLLSPGRNDPDALRLCRHVQSREPHGKALAARVPSPYAVPVFQLPGSSTERASGTSILLDRMLAASADEYGVSNPKASLQHRRRGFLPVREAVPWAMRYGSDREAIVPADSYRENSRHGMPVSRAAPVLADHNLLAALGNQHRRAGGLAPRQRFVRLGGVFQRKALVDRDLHRARLDHRGTDRRRFPAISLGVRVMKPASAG